MKEIFVIAEKEIREVFKNKIFIMMAVLFVIFSILSVYIGSTTKHAEIKAYNETIALLKANGTSSFPDKPEIFTLTILLNNIPYTTIVGALMAIFIGFDSFSKERKYGNIKLILSRPVYSDQLLTGKILGSAIIIGLLETLVFILGLLLLIFIGGFVPAFSEIIRFLTFSIIAFFYLMLFFVTALLFSILFKSEVSSFLASITFWIGVSFVIPQIGESLRAFAYSTNIDAQNISLIPQDTVISKMVEIFSPAVHFENIGRNLLQIIPDTAKLSLPAIFTKIIADFAYFLIPLFGVGIINYWGVLKYEVENA